MIETATPHAELVDLPPFEGLSEDQRLALMRCATLVRCDAGDTLFREGEPATAFYFLQSGRVKMRKISASGHEVVLHLASPPRMIGCPALTMPNSSYPADAVALDSVAALRFTRQHFLETVAATPEVFLGLLLEMNRRLGEIYTLQSARLEPVEQRIAILLLHQALPKEVAWENWAGHPVEEVRITKSLIAAIVGTSTETAIRVLSKWRKRKLVASERGKIRILRTSEIYKIALGNT